MHAADTQWNQDVDDALSSKALAPALAVADTCPISCQELALVCVSACAKLRLPTLQGLPTLRLTGGRLAAELADVQQRIDDKPRLISDLSVLQLYLLVSAYREASRGGGNFTFQVPSLPPSKQSSS